MFIGNYYFFNKTVFILTKIPQLKRHLIGDNISGDRDVLNLFNKYNAEIKFTTSEIKIAENTLRSMGIPKNGKFICLIVRDSAYLEKTIKGVNWNYHNYRYSNIQNFQLASEMLANKGYFVIRMGSKVKNSFITNSSNVIDYANSKFRNDFMDRYLGANCRFCISTGTGYDSIPLIFRKPIVYVNLVPLGYIPSYSKYHFALTKHHFDFKKARFLSMNEIFQNKLAFALTSQDFENVGVKLIENTPQEILDVVLEIEDYINNPDESKILNNNFIELYKINLDKYSTTKIHGELYFKYSSKFLANNKWFLNTIFN
jgi:putative glycosyltransferase (TIGR04372 family)